MNTFMGHGKCPVCGKEIPRVSTRDNKTRYCSRICASQARYRTRYVGTSSGPANRPTREQTLRLPGDA